MFGLFSFSKVMLIFTDCLFPIVIFTYHGARGVSPIYLVVGAGARYRARADVVARRVPAVAGLPLRRHPGRGRRRRSRRGRLRDGIGRRRSWSRHDARLSLRRCGHRLCLSVTISLVGFVLYKAVQILRDRLLFWHVTET